MIRFSLICLLAMPLVACATEPKSDGSHQLQLQSVSMAPLENESSSLAVMAVEADVAPCERFLNNLEAAEAAVNVERPYPHML